MQYVKSGKEYLPMCNFSLKNKEPPMATHRSIKGLKTDTNNGPLILTQNIKQMIVIPEAITPYNKQITFS